MSSLILVQTTEVRRGQWKWCMSWSWTNWTKWSHE